MDTSETITKVFTKYDPIISRVIIPAFRQIEPSAITDDTPINLFGKYGDIFYGEEYHLKTVEKGLEGVVFIHYEKVIPGGFIGTVSTGEGDNSSCGFV